MHINLIHFYAHTLVNFKIKKNILNDFIIFKRLVLQVTNLHFWMAFRKRYFIK